ncbi:tetratricopeptide repeat protein [Anatilimnocola floriformis]|uniref:tetratricopeptide repeat protein n=1 Tax=Anatilimnocola floriformis TaxID=2948575 RepID=UPI0020C2CE96|nr:tetratricopeptide repeat protein [Anatilimnocola floriformis]
MSCTRLLISFAVCAALTTFVSAQQPNSLRPARTAPTEAKPQGTPVEISPAKAIARQMADAYALSKTAKTVDEYSSIIENCERVLAEQTSEETIKYAKQLASWGYNRRGEAFAQQATELIEKGEERKANDLDALALEDFQQAITLDSTKWKAYHNRGVSLGLHGKVEEALADFDQALKLKPDHVNGWFNRAEIKSQLGRYAEAISDYSQVLKLKPDDHGSLVGRAAARRHVGKLDDALKDISHALQIQADYAPAYYERAEIEMGLGQWQSAAEDYRTAARTDNRMGRAFRGVAWLMATCPELKFRNSKLALEAAEKAIDLDGDDDYRTLDVYAAAQANMGQFEQAQATLQKAIQLAPQEAQAALQARLRLYANKQAYREPVRQAAAPANLPR